MSELLAGRYELRERLGSGGMSTVRVALDRRLEREVAVKVLAEHLADDPAFVARFRREALAAARLVHPNVVQVFDFGFDERSHRHFIVMEVVRGDSGAELLREHGRLPVAEAVSMVEQSLRGLDYAHRHGVVHRDVKPGNLLRGPDGNVKLADFGIAKALSDESAITQVGSVLGTAAYLAPEQAAGEEVGPAADLYAMGVVTYQLLSGRLPYAAQSLTELALKQQREVPPRLDDLDPHGIPAPLAAAVERALSLDPRDRFEDAEAMRVALTDGAEGRGDATSATRAVTATDATSIARRPEPTQRVPPQQPRRPRAPRAPVAAPAPAPSRRGRGAGAQAPASARRRRPLRRLLLLLVVLAACAAAGAAVVVGLSPSQEAVQLRELARDDLGDLVTDLRGLVEDNTR